MRKDSIESLVSTQIERIIVELERSRTVARWCLIPYIYLSLSNAKKLITIPEIDKTMLKEMKYITYIRPEMCRR